MVNYEPELMYALDSKSEYADWKNVYNVSGSDVLYCPICLGRVKLWNGQDPDKTYKKQRCFHHIDGICSQESRIHFAYKTWLLEKGSKFKVGEFIYEVDKSEIEKTLHTKFGNYRPDIIVETTDNKKFYIEIADTNKKTENYIEKWDELCCDVLELDVNEQLIKATVNGIPEFKLIYSSVTGECYIKHYIRQDYDDLITERKIYWKRKDLLKYKIQWERLDWFWRKLQDFYLGESKIDILIEAFKQMDCEDQKFVCKRMRGKHSSLKYELENNYTDKNDLESAHLQHISFAIRKLNQEFKCTSTSSNVYLFRKNIHIIFKNSSDWTKRPYMCIDNNTTEENVYEYFHPIMKKFFEDKKEKELLYQKNKMLLENQLKELKQQINNCKNRYWRMNFYASYKFTDNSYLTYYNVEICLLNTWSERLIIYIGDVENNYSFIKEEITNKMRYLYKLGKNGTNSFYSYENIRIMEEC